MGGSDVFNRGRGFEVIDHRFRRDISKEVILPRRATQQSAAYDIFSLETHSILPGQKQKFHTDVKAYMRSDEVLLMYPRSSQGIKLDLTLANTTGVIDADYYSNPENDGEIAIFLRNVGDVPVMIKEGDRIAQAVFTKYLVADNEPADLPERTGGVGSTGR
jgi:dUTP pyrophosphatase